MAFGLRRVNGGIWIYLTYALGAFPAHMENRVTETQCEKILALFHTMIKKNILVIYNGSLWVLDATVWHLSV